MPIIENASKSLPSLLLVVDRGVLAAGFAVAACAGAAFCAGLGGAHFGRGSEPARKQPQ